MKLLNEQDFNSEIKKENLTVVDFFADWCGPCKMIAPFMEQLSEQYTDVSWNKVNVDDSPTLAAEFNVTSIPTIIFFKNGVEVKRSIGFKPIEQLEQMVDEAKKA